MGYLSESIGITARHQRCQQQWGYHLRKTQETITRFLARHPEVKSILFCGSGPGFDIPWKAPEFQSLERIVLVDLIHPWEIRWRALQQKNIELHTVDLSGVVDSLSQGVNCPEPKVNWSIQVDLVVSLNVLSQLPLMPLESMEKKGAHFSESELHLWARAIQKHHLETSKRWAPRQIIISDTEERWVDATGRVLEKLDPWYGAQWFEPEERWEWEISPFGEIDPQKAKVHQVGAISITRSI